jgi:nitroreductase
MQNEDLDIYKPLLSKEIKKFRSNNIGNNKGGIKKIPKYENFDFSSFVKSRSSLRIFSEKPIDRQIINLCVDDAKYCPSVCNRQSWKAHYFDRSETVLKLLNLQDGNNGFTENIRALFVITTDLCYFTNLEYNQVFVEGGIFSMNLVHSLHARGIGSCCLNLCVPFVREKIIKETAGIGNNERLIMMIGIGYYNDNNLVAYSNRKDTNDILFIH